MKRVLFFFCLCLLSITSCTNPPEVINQTFAPEQEDLYTQCSGLKGIGEFVIGETSYKQALNSKYYRDSYVFNNFYNGHWGVHSHDLSDWIEKRAPIIKQITTPIDDVKIGQIKLTTFDLAFYNNKLAAIYFKDESGELHEHYIKKYGEGRGTYYSYHQDNEPCNNRDRLIVIDTRKENRVWENEKVELTYSHDYHFEMGPNISEKQRINSYYDNSWYLITSKTLYPKFLEELNKQKAAYDKHRQSEDKESLNQF